MDTNILQKPKTLVRTLSTALISWDDISSNIKINENNNNDAKYILQMETPLREWKNIYWGPKTQFLVRNMAPCNCYNFRLKFYNDKAESDWINFKSGTDAIPYFVLHFTRAVKFGKTPVIRKIINRRPILLETESKEGKTPLIQAVESGSLQMVTFLVNLGANVNTATLITKRTPLMVALFNNNIHISNVLLDKGANVSARDCNYLTALHYAIDSDFYENVELCLNHELDIDAQDNQGWTPLLRAVIMNCSDEIIELLLSKGANTTIKDKNGFNLKKHLKLANRTNFERFAVKLSESEKEDKDGQKLDLKENLEELQPEQEISSDPLKDETKEELKE